MLPLPPLEVQKKIANRVQEVRTMIVHEHERAEKLFQEVRMEIEAPILGKKRII